MPIYNVLNYSHNKAKILPHIELSNCQAHLRFSRRYILFQNRDPTNFILYLSMFTSLIIT